MASVTLQKAVLILLSPHSHTNAIEMFVIYENDPVVEILRPYGGTSWMKFYKLMGEDWMKNLYDKQIKNALSSDNKILLPYIITEILSFKW